MNLPKLITILGPTASGKSGLAIRLAKKFSGEIVSADSRQIYRGLVIGSGLVKGEWKKDTYLSENIPHHLVQFIEPDEDFSAAQFKELALIKISKIQKKGNLPFLVGGTGLYVDAVTKNLEIPKVKPNKALRQKLDKKSNEVLLAQLASLDVKAAQNIDKHNKRRLIRAIEVSLLGDSSFSSSQKKGPRLFEVLRLGIKIDRHELYKKIDQRVDQMIEDGLISEVENLLKLYSKNSSAFSGIGYKQVIEYLNGEINEREMIQKIKTATHAYARRQITWLKRDKEINWVDDYKKAEKLVKRFIS